MSFTPTRRILVPASILLLLAALPVPAETPPYDGATEQHWHEASDLSFGLYEFALQSDVDGTSGSIVQRVGIGTLYLGRTAMGAIDWIGHEFSVPTSGWYEITFKPYVSGKVLNVSNSLILGSAWAGGEIRLEGKITEFAEETTVITPLYEKVPTLGTFVTEGVWSAVWASLGAGDVVGALGILASTTTPAESWSADHFPMTTNVHLEQGRTYQWSFMVVSTTACGSVGIAQSSLLFEVAVNLSEVEVTLISGALLSNPRVNPTEGPSNTLFTYRVHYLDPAGQGPTGARIYIDALPHDMALESGQPHNGTYIFETLLGPGPHTYFFSFTDVQNNEVHTPIIAGPTIETLGSDFAISAFNWEDRPPDDGDGVMEAGESPSLRIRLRNNATEVIENVDAVLRAPTQDINITDPDVYYEYFTPGQSSWSVGAFDMHLNFVLTNCDTRTNGFILHVTYEKNNLPFFQDIVFTKTFYQDGCLEAAFGIEGAVAIDDSPAFRSYNNGNGQIESGELVHLRPRLCNVGTALATDIEVRLSCDNPAIEIPGSDWERYPDLQAGGCGNLDSGDSFQVEVIDRGFDGPISLDLHIVTNQNPVEQVVTNAISLTVHPAPWLSVPVSHDFGVVAPGTVVSFVSQIGNHGTADLHVTNIIGQKCDGSAASDVSISPTSFTVAPGATQSITVMFDTTGLIGQVCRNIFVQSDGRINQPGEDDRLILTGLVANSIATHIVPGATGTEVPDIGGNIIVWTDYRNGNGDIYAYDVLSDTEFPIVTQPHQQYRPFVSGDLVVWRDGRNRGATNNQDIFAYDLSTETEYPVSTSPLQESLIGVDGTLIAIMRLTETLPSPCNFCEIWNLVVFAYQGNGVFQEVYSSNHTSPAYGDYGNDFGEGMLVLWKKVGGHEFDVFDYSNGGALYHPVLPNAQHPMAAAAQRFIYQWEGANSNDDHISMWRTSGQTEDVVPRIDFGNEDYCNPGADVVAVGGPDGSDILVYDYDCTERRQGLYFWDRATNSEGLLSSSGGSTETLRMDGYGVVWTEYPILKYAFFKQPEIAVAAADIVPSNQMPVEGESFDVTVQVRNVADFPTTEDVLVRLYFGDPDQGGVQQGTDQVISPGLAGGAQTSVPFANLVAPPVTVGDEQALDICAKAFPADIEDPSNNKACVNLMVQDDDVDPPVFEYVRVEEHLGDGDGVISDMELCRIAWSATDPSGLSMQQVWLDGNPLDPEGQTFVVVGPLSPGMHTATVRVTDGDTTPEHRERSEEFLVDACPDDPEKIEPGVCGCGTSDTDSDGDSVLDCDDICPGSDDLADADGDTVPDGCDPCPSDNPDDSDNDGVCDSDDVCPGHDDTQDADGDGIPDGCDICPGHDDLADADGDEVPDGCDTCPLDNPDDSDNDGVCDSDDTCPGQDDTQDADGDGVPDGCDICVGFDDNQDADADGVPDGCDLCSDFDDGLDADVDGVPDGCDICPDFDDNMDDDKDGVPNGCDNCPDDPEKIAPGLCGCGAPEPTEDTNGNGLIDVGDCIVPILHPINLLIVGNGAATKDPDKNLYEVGEVVTLRAIPDACWQFDKWEGDDVSGLQNPVQVTVGENGVSATVNFTEDANGCGCGLCAAGAGGVLPFMIFGMFLMKNQVRRRRWRRVS